MILSAASWKMYESRELLRLKRHLIQSQSFAISLSIRMKYTGWNAKKLKLIGCLLSTVRGKSMKDIAYFVAEKIAPLEGIQSTCTHFILKSYKEHGAILTDQPKPERLVITP